MKNITINPTDFATLVICSIRYCLSEGGESVKNITINPTDFATLAICAIRYCHGRQTYMPSLVQGIIRPHLTELEDRDLAVLLQDCEGMSEFDYGDPVIDKPNWERWHEDLKKEKERREAEE